MKRVTIACIRTTDKQQGQSHSICSNKLKRSPVCRTSHMRSQPQQMQHCFVRAITSTAQEQLQTLICDTGYTAAGQHSFRTELPQVLLRGNSPPLIRTCQHHTSHVLGSMREATCCACVCHSTDKDAYVSQSHMIVCCDFSSKQTDAVKAVKSVNWSGVG